MIADHEVAQTAERSRCRRRISCLCPCHPMWPVSGTDAGDPPMGSALEGASERRKTNPVNNCPNCVLVVDDDPSIRQLIATFLRRRGYVPIEAKNGREALHEMRAGDAQIVVLDLMMPEVSGWDVLEERAKDPLLQSIPVVVVSANFGPEAARALDKGICALLPKPFDLDALEAIVKTCLAHPHGPAAV